MLMPMPSELYYINLSTFQPFTIYYILTDEYIHDVGDSRTAKEGNKVGMIA